MCNYVLNVIPEPLERLEVLDIIYRLLKPEGVAFITVRGIQELRDFTNLIPCGDGYVTKNKTFQKYFLHTDLVLFVENTFPLVELLSRHPPIAKAFKTPPKYKKIEGEESHE